MIAISSDDVTRGSVDSPIYFLANSELSRMAENVAKIPFVCFQFQKTFLCRDVFRTRSLLFVWLGFRFLCVRLVESLCRSPRRRQRERHQTKDLIGRIMALHVRYNSWYISLPSSTKQHYNITKAKRAL